MILARVKSLRHPAPMNTLANLPPKALVTGGNGNLGEAVARLLLRSGYQVHVTVHDEHTRASFAYGLMKEGLQVHVADLTKPADCGRLAQEVGPPLDAQVATA